MPGTRAPWGALLAFWMVLFSALPASARPGQATLAERRASLARQNLIRDGGFEGEGRGWALRGARTTGERPYAGDRALRLSAHAGGQAKASVVVPIIPGIYELSAALRLSGVRLPHGKVLSDRFHTRVAWLDAGGRPLPGPEGGPAGAERPYPLAFIAGSPEASWQRAVFVSSYENPAGDEAPSGAALARISFVLDGPGRADIDEVRFTYSRRNLALAERVAPYRTLDADALGRVIPTPRHLVEHGPAVPVRRMCLSYRGEPSPGFADRVAALEARLGGLGASLVRPRENGTPSADCDLTLHLTRADGGAVKDAAGLLDEARTLPPEGYVIETRNGEAGADLFAVGADRTGMIYAVETVRQLLRPHPSGAAALRAVEIRDWPAFRGRSLAAWEPGAAGMRTILHASRWLSAIKLNRLYLNYPLRSPRWWQPPETYRALLSELGERAVRTRLYELGILLNPYVQRSDPSITDTFQISRREDVEILWSEIAGAVDAGTRIVMLCLDDFLPTRNGGKFSYHLDDPEDQRRFRSLADAHLWLVDYVRGRLREIAPEATLVIVPPWYNERYRELGGADAHRYMRALAKGLPADIGVAWTGPTVRSRIVDDVTTTGFSESIGGRPLVLWDNSVWELELSPFYAGSPQRAGRVSLFEPFHIETDNLSRTSFRGEFYFNGSSGGRFLAKAMTLADYLWNPEAYDPDRSIWRAMVAQWGHETAGLLLDWDNAYWQERAWINRLGAEGGTPGKETALNLRKARALSRKRWEALQKALGPNDATLNRELRAWVDEQEGRLRNVRAMGKAGPEVPRQGGG